MKASFYTEQIVARSRDIKAMEINREHQKDALLDIGISVTKAFLIDLLDVAKGRHSDVAAHASIREGLTKWKAVVRGVHKLIPDHPITVNYIGVMIAMTNKALFQRLVTHRVFIGYTFTPVEQEIMNEVQTEVSLAEVHNHVANLLRKKMQHVSYS